MTPDKRVENWIDENMPRRVDGGGDKWHTREEVIQALTQYHKDLMSEVVVEKLVAGDNYNQALTKAQTIIKLLSR